MINVFPISAIPIKPDRLIKENEKDKAYHSKYARWVIGNALTQKHYEFLADYATNYNFYKNNQWIDPEDIEAFFLDDSGNDRNRIKVTRNYIQPMVEQYRGSASRMRFNHKAYSVSPLAKTRRDEKLYRLLSYRDVAQILPSFGDFLKSQGVPIESTEEGTIGKFENLYVDKFVIAINRLIRYFNTINNINMYIPQFAADLALAGIAIATTYPYNGQWMMRRVSPDRFGWDRAAINPDLSDSEFFYEFEPAIVTSLYEMYPDLDEEERQKIEDRVKISFLNTPFVSHINMGYRIPVYTAVWRDCVKSEFGYIRDEFGQTILVRVNYIEPNEDKPRYTDKDLLPLKSLTEYQKKVLGGKNKRSLIVDQWRYCKFIPYESMIRNVGENKYDEVLDVILDYGVLPYQENNLYSPINMMPPYKVGTWSYFDGEVLAPVSVAINPQRMINRFLSVMEFQINASGGSGIVWDKDLFLDGTTDSEEDINIKIKRGQPIGVHGRGRGIQNSIGAYNAGIRDNTVIFANLIENYKQSIEQITGVNSALTGQVSNPDQLVGVLQLMIQRGSIIQQPFYDALALLFKNIYQNVASCGKRYYIDNEVQLIDAVGDDFAEIIEVSKDMRLENFRIEISASADTGAERQVVDALAAQWLQAGIIDKDIYSQIYGKASYEEAIFAMRDYVKKSIEMQRMAAQQAQFEAQAQNQLQAAQNEALYQEQLRQENREDLNAEKERATKIYLKNMQNRAKMNTPV